MSENEEREPYVQEIDDLTCFCLNGVSGFLRENEEDSSMIDFVDENGKVYTIDDSAHLTIVGGGVGYCGEYDEINVTLESGTVMNIFAGTYNSTGEQSEEIEKVNVTINGGKITNVANMGTGKIRVQEGTITVNGGEIANVSGGVMSYISGYGNFNNSDPNETSVSTVLNSNLIVNGGEITTGYVGGSSGYNYTKNGYFEMNGGYIYEQVSASNGNVDNVSYVINDGEIEILHPANRGNVKNAEFVINGGTGNLYCGCDTIDSSETGTIESVSINITGGTYKVYAGTSGKEPITASDNIIKSLSYVEGTATFEDGFLEEFADIIHEITYAEAGDVTFGTGSAEAMQKAIENGTLKYPAYIFDTDGDHVQRFVNKRGEIVEMGSKIEVDETPTEGSENAVSSDGVYQYVKDAIDEAILGAIKEDY